VNMDEVAPPAGRHGDRANGHPDRSKQKLLSAAFLLLMVVAVYGRSLGNHFVGDDWMLISNIAAGFEGVIDLEDSYHFNPIPEFCLLVLFKSFGLSKVAYHAAGLGLFWAAAVLTAAIGRRLGREPWHGVLAATLFVCFGSQYEAAIWATVALWYGTSALLYLTGVYAFIRSRQEGGGGRRWYWVFVAAVGIGPFAHEQTVSLVGVGFLHWVFSEGGDAYRHSRRYFLGLALRIFVAPGILLSLWLCFKLWLAARVATPQAPGLSAPPSQLALAWATAALRGLVPGLGPWPASELAQYLEHPDGAGWIPLALLLGGAALAIWIGSQSVRFLVGWLALSTTTIVLGIGGAASRHLLLIAVPSSLLWAWATIAAGRCASGVIRRRRPSRRDIARLSGATVTIVMALVPIASGVRYAGHHQHLFREAGMKVETILSSIFRTVSSGARPSRLYLVNMPDHYLSVFGEEIYVFRNAPAGSVHLTYPGMFNRVMPVSTRNASPSVTAYAPLASKEDLARYAAQSSALVLEYDEKSGRIRRWRAVPPADFRNMRRITEGILFSVDTVAGRVLQDPSATVRVPAASPVRIEGWAIDAMSKVPAGAVIALIDAKVQVDAVIGGSRNDLVPVFDTAAYANAGWTLIIPGPALTPGQHVISFRFVSGDLTSFLEPPLTVVLDAGDIEIDPARLPRSSDTTFAFVETIGGRLVFEQATEALRVAAGEPVEVAGWAVDYPNRRTAAAVYVLLDGKSSHRAQYGISRNDVAQNLSCPCFERSGFRVVLPPLAPGPHSITLLVSDVEQQSSYRPATINVIAGSSVQ
jgi:hypothetical protein